MSKHWKAAKEHVFFTQKRDTCEIRGPGCEVKATQGHHGIVSRNYSKAAKKYKLIEVIDQPWNFISSCGVCNVGKVWDNFEGRKQAIRVSLQHGYKVHDEMAKIPARFIDKELLQLIAYASEEYWRMKKSIKVRGDTVAKT